MTEVDDFTQSDLDEEDVMLLDAWQEVRGQRCSARLQVHVCRSILCPVGPPTWELDCGIYMSVC